MKFAVSLIIWTICITAWQINLKKFLFLWMVLVNHALNLASLTDGVITGLHVIPHVPAGGPRTKAYDKQLLQEGKTITENAKKIADKKGIKFNSRVVRGWPGLETVKIAKSGKYDHIVMSTTGTGSAKGDMLGSVSNYVLHKSHIPVYLIK